MRNLRLAAAATLLIVTLFVTDAPALAQGGPSVAPQVPGNTVPAWVFYWVLGLASVAGSSLFLVIKILWDKASRTSGLSEDERNQLKQLHEWHAQKDSDQVPLWYTPRSWLNLIEGLQRDHATVRELLSKIVEQNTDVNTDLRQRVREGQERHDRLYAKMLRLAIRVQQAVEALAGLETPSIEAALDDTDEDN